MNPLVAVRSLWPFGLVLFGVFLGAGSASLYYTAKIDRKAAMDSKLEAQIATATRIASEKAIEKQNATETGYLAKLKEAQHETARIGTMLANQSLRLRVTGVSETCTDSSPLAAGTAEPSEQLRRAYSAIRSDIDIVQSNLELCIQTLKNERE